jgi:hypothetical protein
VWGNIKTDHEESGQGLDETGSGSHSMAGSGTDMVFELLGCLILLPHYQL